MASFSISWSHTHKLEKVEKGENKKILTKFRLLISSRNVSFPKKKKSVKRSKLYIKVFNNKKKKKRKVQ